MTARSRPWLKHYDYWVPPHLTYPSRPLHEILDTVAVDLPDAPATSFLGATLTFRAIKERSDRFAAALAGIGLPDTDMKIVDLLEGTKEMPIGEPGELCIAGPQVMKGCWNRPEETAEVLRVDADGRVWLHTGDIATMDEDGYTTIVQRKKDMMIVDGFNVYPSEVETVLYLHPAVRLAAAIGEADAYHGEVVRAYVALKPGAAATLADLIAHCKAQLAPYKVPQTIEVRETLPMSTVGKILYRVLRDELASGQAPPAQRPRAEQS